MALLFCILHIILAISIGYLFKRVLGKLTGIIHKTLDYSIRTPQGVGAFKEKFVIFQFETILK